MAPSRNLSISLFAIVSVSFSSFMFGSLNPSLIRARTLIHDLIYDSYRDGIKQKPTSSHLSSSKVVPFSSSSQALLCQMEKNKAKNGSKSSPSEFN
ncbi:hypothetical protein F2Q70_00036322 [Brassica cretica]|uniref:Uncharacterized protein n=1 Tax=Brassica cretica TaxID=69181 RepID=A0A8S9JWY7_BRACR|nr:hypothetical protein F2Q70_00036322 [Brassica cretica]